MQVLMLQSPLKFFSILEQITQNKEQVLKSMRFRKYNVEKNAVWERSFYL